MTQMEWEKVADKILTLDSKIRFVEIAFPNKTYTKWRLGVIGNLTPMETEESIEDSLARWKTRRKLAHKLGNPLYAMAEYEKVKRISIPIDHVGLILVTLDSEGFHEIILKEILEIKENVQWNLK